MSRGCAATFLGGRSRGVEGVCSTPPSADWELRREGGGAGREGAKGLGDGTPRVSEAIRGGVRTVAVGGGDQVGSA